ncbi:transglycosylase SLT domain-containing protein [Streptomyces sp. NPDC048142]|uniref:transglycosylase SLT domain-containing protein n=1 Tax=Streptomyces sp. NPDC048142 TaxID=3365501 RepID=UPI0037158A19
MASTAALSLIAAGATAVPRGEEQKAMYAPETPEQDNPKATTPTPPPSSQRGAQKRAKVAERYKVKPGDSLSSIAEAELGDADHWPNLWGANLGTVGKDPDALHPGTLLELRMGKPPALKASKGNARNTIPVPDHTGSAYADNLDGWIREALFIMGQHGIPGSYKGIHRNVMRESGGDPKAVNNWDSNAAAGTPSKGLLQTIDPTFRAYHVPGTSWDVFDPVANIVAACHYASSRYGSIDNVFGAY